MALRSHRLHADRSEARDAHADDGSASVGEARGATSALAHASSSAGRASDPAVLVALRRILARTPLRELSARTRARSARHDCSMRADAEKLTGPVWSSEDDPRITKIGRFVRKTRLDELPQLFNILAGSMSIVGPRPERQHFVDELGRRIPYYNQRHIVKPGLTGWAQINYPYGNTVEDSLHKLQYDLFYIKNHSVLFDLSILFSTIKTVLLRQGT